MNDVLSRSGLFHGLPAEVIEPVAARLETLAVPAGTVIFREGEPGDALYIVLAGRIRLTRRSPDGKEKVLAQLGPAEHFGELAVFEPCPRTETATTVTDVQLARVPHSVLRPWIESHPEIGERLLRVLARRLWGTKPWVPDLFFTDVPGRLARALMLLTDKFGRRTPEGVRLQFDVSVQELTGLVGASPETVESAMADFVERGWIRREGGSILILDPDQLRRRVR
ncbi:Crp/Fnr family transcriptional regulator [Blastococcus sp. MG754426]|uniref:Crp/Fnr family transcriptional regulator n=1 Tax=Blastococcus sp. MG754426 TaxID=2570317 RepID=UPI0027E0D7F8|nr:Crp/Fnr family transcriptional regulator [Blastococcus sp. MG754426]MCF6509180.1 Crp/Fnr family transcriptional regulator [Blastococcus sp. MG754426]MCF6513729.1 Crp/Fnr family transcriptional regulator [Blastococcus sp. MG754427]